MHAPHEFRQSTLSTSEPNTCAICGKGREYINHGTMRVTIARTASGVVSTITPPPRAHVAMVKYRDRFHVVCVNAGQVSWTFDSDSKEIVQGFMWGMAHGAHLAKLVDFACVHIDAPDKTTPVTEAYANWFVDRGPLVK